MDNVPEAELGPTLMDRVERLHLAEKGIHALPTDNPIKPLAEVATESGAYDRAERLLAAARLQGQAVDFVSDGRPDQAITALNEAEKGLGEISMNSPPGERLVHGYIFKPASVPF